jgi:hypothetical protein
LLHVEAAKGAMCRSAQMAAVPDQAAIAVGARRQSLSRL